MDIALGQLFSALAAGYLNYTACRNRGRHVYRLMIFKSLSSFFTPTRCLPHEPSLHTGTTLNYSLRLYGLFVCVPQSFTLTTGLIYHVNLTSTPQFSTEHEVGNTGHFASFHCA